MSSLRGLQLCLLNLFYLEFSSPLLSLPFTFMYGRDLTKLLSPALFICQSMSSIRFSSGFLSHKHVQWDLKTVMKCLGKGLPCDKRLYATVHNSKDGGRYVRKANSKHAHVRACSEPLLMLDPESSLIWGLDAHQCKLKLSPHPELWQLTTEVQTAVTMYAFSLTVTMKYGRSIQL